jgi:hypothetical protein
MQFNRILEGRARQIRTLPQGGSEYLDRGGAGGACLSSHLDFRQSARVGAAKVAVLKEASPSFVIMRGLAMRFRGLLRGEDSDKFGSWLDDARHSGIHALQQFARILARDIDAVRNAIAEPWSSGPAEGQINRLKNSQAGHVRPRGH